MRNVFRATTMAHSGDDWLIADFGVDVDGKHYIITTDSIHASELYSVSRGAKSDAELVASLLNEHFQAIVEKEQLRRQHSAAAEQPHGADATNAAPVADTP